MNLTLRRAEKVVVLGPQEGRLGKDVITHITAVLAASGSTGPTGASGPTGAT